MFGWESGPGGNLTVPAQAPLSGLLRTDPAERVLYLGVADTTAALAEVVANTAKVP